MITQAIDSADSKRRQCRVLTRVAAIVFCLFIASPAMAAPIERVSLTESGGEPAGNSLLPALSADGRHVAFVSAAPGITADDDDTTTDVFVRDRATGTIVLVSKSSSGEKGDLNSGDILSYGKGGPAVSATGRFVAFSSLATNLAPDEPDGIQSDIFVHDRDADGDGIFDEPGEIATVIVSIASDGTAADGGHNQNPAISADGRFVAFTSAATNLVAGDTNGVRDIFVHDRDADGNGIFDEPGGVATTRVSVATGGGEANDKSGPDLEMSADGNVIAFISDASNLVPFDFNGVDDVFAHDRATGITERVNVSSSGAEASPPYDAYELGLSGNGRYVAFTAQDPDLAEDTTGYGGVAPQGGDVFIHDRLTRRTTTWADGAESGRKRRTTSHRPTLSHDGTIIAFYTRFGMAFFADGSEAKNHVELYVHDRSSQRTATRPIQAADGAATSVLARGISLSHDADIVAIDSEGADLVPGDGNGKRDVFVLSCPLARPSFELCEPLPFSTLEPNDQARFELGSREFRAVETVAGGLGPVFNATSCVACHSRPWVGGTSDTQVTRIANVGPGGFDPLVDEGGPVIQTDGISVPGCDVPGEVVPASATLVTQRDVPALFGAGLIDLIPDDNILRFADADDRNGDGISGRPNWVGGRVGRFGHKAQIATLHEFAADAYVVEMGVTSPDRPDEVLPQGVPLCDPAEDPEDDGTDVQRFVDFISLLAPLPAGEYPSKQVKREARTGRRLFRRARCQACHTERMRIPRSLLRPLGVKRVELYSDLLLHDMGPGLADGIEQEDATGSEFRTAPLWGVGWSAPYLHDGRAATLEAAILAHGGEAQTARDSFAALSATDRAAVVTFLRSL
jgi:Tol biopolymer transport system component